MCPWLWRKVQCWIAAAAVLLAVSACVQPPADDPASRYNRLFAQATDKLEPHIILHGRDTRPPERAEVLEAIALFDQALAIFPDQWASIFFQGKAWQALHEHETAYEHFLRAYKLMPDEPSVAKEFIGAALRIGRIPEAREVSDLAVLQWPRDVAIVSNHALVLMFDGQLAEAEAQAVRAFEMDPSDAVSANVVVTIEDVRAGRIAPPKNLQELEGW